MKNLSQKGMLCQLIHLDYLNLANSSLHNYLTININSKKSPYLTNSNVSPFKYLSLLNPPQRNRRISSLSSKTLPNF
jgi:hypothetical protein